MNYQDPALRRKLTDEYVLGTLQGPARRRFERLIQMDAEWRAELDATARQLNVLAEVLPPTPVPNRVWDQVQQRIAPSRLAAVPTRLSWWERLGFWQGCAITASALSVLLAVYIAVRPLSPAASTLIVVITDDAQKRASWVVSTTADASRLTIEALKPHPLPADRVFQLWVKFPQEVLVRPVGLIPAAGRTTLPVATGLATQLVKAEKFGVSIEPPGGSPTGQPTTPAQFHGALLRH